MADTELTVQVRGSLDDLWQQPGEDPLAPLKRLFWEFLSYDRVDEGLSRDGWTQKQNECLAEDPVIFASAGDDDGFKVIYARLASDRLLLTPERAVVTKLLAANPYSLFVFSNRQQNRWHFVNVREHADVEKRRLYRRITVGPEEKLRTAAERLSLLDIGAVGGLTLKLIQPSALEIQREHDKAFDVEAVTKRFFDDYQSVFERLQADLVRQTGDDVWAHDYALQFMNRLMFLYFIQRKRWIGGDTEFLRTFWEAYQDADQPADSFFRNWLSVMFFEAFNNRFHGGHTHFPEGVKQALQLAPFLNGGLFLPNELDTQSPKPYEITDSRFAKVFTFLEGYNFTIAEDSPLDQEVAVDPEMIGKVYESLVNVSSEADERGDAGIFYTPRTEIDLMCRLALVDNLANHLGEEHKNTLYEIVFALTPDEKDEADNRADRSGLLQRIDERLAKTTVVDPACGSGSFLVGMLHIIDDLRDRAARKGGRVESAYDRKKQIIGQSLYGVDVMEWACHVAELRLWLALIIDADIDPNAAHVRREPLLPHFSFNIRCGDSLVQEVGGVNLSHIKGASDVPGPIKRKITIHKQEKLRFYNNDPDRKYRTEDDVKHQELLLFRELLDAQHQVIEDAIADVERRLAAPVPKQVRLDGSVDEGNAGRDTAAAKRQLADMRDRLERVSEARDALRTVRDVPFVWDIAFVEVFTKDDGGFDIVVGNPPYVSDENIGDPCGGQERTTASGRSDYRNRLARSVYASFPTFFGYKSRTGPKLRRIHARSDLYLYFYFHGLSLLNEHGSFCFITSNSWLDVDYGAILQEFMVKHSHVKLVVDNRCRRSFAEADVNTVIALMAAADDRRLGGTETIARFVMFSVPFEDVLSPVVFQEIDEAAERRTTPDYRVFPVPQSRLLEAGCLADATVDAARRTSGQTGASGLPLRLLAEAKYVGEKWGGVYLRAPEIALSLMQLVETGQMTRLANIADVELGIMTGANDFFYLTAMEARGDLLVCRNEAGHEMEIESRFLRPVLRGTEACDRPWLDEEAMRSVVFYCNEDRRRIKGTRALDYIKWGESVPVTVKQGRERGRRVKGYNSLRFFESREPWYSIGKKEPFEVVCIKAVGDAHKLAVIPEGGLFDQRFYGLRFNDGSRKWASMMACLSVVWVLFRELYGRANLGGGALDMSTADIRRTLLPAPSSLPPENVCRSMVEELQGREWGSVHEEIVAEDRVAIDEACFAAIGLTDRQRTLVRDAVTRLVDLRLSKATSLRPHLDGQ